MGLTEGAPNPSFHCKVYEDNSGTFEMIREYKYCPINKFLNVKLHHFKDYVGRGGITIHKIRTEYQPEGYITKLLNVKTYVKQRKEVQGW